MEMLNEEDLENITGGTRVIHYNFTNAARDCGVKKSEIGELRLQWMNAGSPEPSAWIKANYKA